MLGWGACGAVGALLAPMLQTRARARRGRAPCSGFAFSASMDVWLWWGFFPHTLASLAAVIGRGLWFDVVARRGQRRDRARGRARAPADARALRQPAEDGGRVGLAALVAALVLARVAGLVRAVEHASNGAFAEPRRAAPTPQLTAWAVLGLRAAGATAPGVARLPAVTGVDRSQSTTDVALVALAEEALGAQPDALLARLRGREAERPDRARRSTRPSGRCSRSVTRRRRRCASSLAHQAKSGGFSWGVRRPGRLERHRRRARGAAGRGRARRAGDAGGARSCSASRTSDGGFELTRRPRLRRAVDGVGDPGPRRRRPDAAAGRVRLPGDDAPPRRQLPLLGEVRDDAGVGHVAGAGRAGAEAVPCVPR